MESAKSGPQRADMGPPAAVSSFVQQHYRHNFWVNLLDGAFFTFGLAFFSSTTLLPVYVQHLTNSALLIGLVPAIAQAGWFLPQLLTARQVERRRRRLPFVVLVSANERFPVLFLGLSILLWPGLRPDLALLVFFVLLTWQSLGGGLTASGWVDLVARVIPVNRRGRLLGLTNLLGSVMGVGGAALAAYFLRTLPFPHSFGLAFVAAAIAFLISWFFLSLNREPPAATGSSAPKASRAYWASLPGILWRNGNLRRYLLARIPGILGLMANGFLVVYAARQFNLPDEVAGAFTAAFMIAGALANPLAGMLGDRLGHKVVMELSTLTQGLALMVALLAGRGEWFYLVFALQGISSAASLIAAVSIGMEFGTEDDRPTVASLINSVQGVFYMIAPLLGGLLAGLYGYRFTFWCALGLLAVALVALRVMVTEPREIK